MYTEDDFLEAMHQSPDDDDLRLVFSDWLEDQDDGRAAFLRLQVQRRRLAPDDPAEANLIGQQHALIRRSLANWLAPLADYGVYILRRHGMLGISLSGEQLENLTEDDLDEPAWKWVDGLRLYRLWNHDLAKLFEHPALDHFRQIDLSRNTIAEAALRVLAGRSLPRLASLDLEQVNQATESASLLAGAVWLPQLRGLNLSSNPLGSIGITELVRQGSFAQLRVLALLNCGAGAMAVASLIAAEFFPRLEALGLASNPLTNEGGHHLMRFQRPTRLQLLDLRDTGITGKRLRSQLQQKYAGLVL